MDAKGCSLLWNLLVYADCRQSPETLKEHKTNKGSEWGCQEARYEIFQNNNIAVCSFKRHSRCAGNNRADKLTRKASNQILYDLAFPEYCYLQQ